MYEHDLIAVRFYDDPIEAHLARCLLENEGIEAFVHDEHIIGLNRMFSYALGGIKLKVAAAAKADALRILDETEHRPYLDEEERPLHCPKCGSTALTSGISKPRTASAMFHWALALLFSVHPLSLDRSMRCDGCGHLFPPAG